MLEVGQVLYLVALKTAKVVPARVTAVTVTKTLDGEAVSHRLEFADAPGQEISLEELNVEIFKSGAELRKFMLVNATAAVEKQVAEAEQKVVSWGVPVEQPAKKRRRRSKKKTTSPPVESTEDSSVPENGIEKFTVMLEDGVKANVILPAELI